MLFLVTSRTLQSTRGLLLLQALFYYTPLVMYTLQAHVHLLLSLSSTLYMYFFHILSLLSFSPIRFLSFFTFSLLPFLLHSSLPPSFFLSSLSFTVLLVFLLYPRERKERAQYHHDINKTLLSRSVKILFMER